MLAVAGGKGGVGKTTTTLGLAAALAAERRRPLAVDADADMPDLHVLADVSPDPGVDAVASGRRPASIARAPDRWPGVSVLPAAPGADVAGALPAIRSESGPVVVDCPAGAGPDAARAVRAADRALVVTTPRPPAVEDAIKTVTVARELDTGVAGVLLTRSAAAPDWVCDAFEVPILGAVPDSDGDPLDDDGVRAAYGRLSFVFRGAKD